MTSIVAIGLAFVPLRFSTALYVYIYRVANDTDWRLLGVEIFKLIKLTEKKTAPKLKNH